jgi:hypothetical protein
LLYAQSEELECGGADLLLSEPGEYRFDTTIGELVSPGGSTCAYEETVSGEPPYLSVKIDGDLELGKDSRLAISGIRAVEFIADGDMRLAGEIDVSSRATGPIRGAGADVAPCSGQVSANAGVNAGATGGGGGGGGSLTRNGAAGGEGGGGEAQGAPTGTTVDGWENSFRGGCRGGDGGTWTEDNHDNAAAGGHGGGALRLISGGEIQISGLVHASGAGGEGGLQTVRGGGGGGGSGGMLWLRATSLTMGEGGLSAKGGAGGEGGSACGDGADGQDAAGLLEEQAAGGLTSANCDAGGDGGGGSQGKFSGADPGINGAAQQGGGGGGGAPGIIFLEVSITPAVDPSLFSPPPMLPNGNPVFPDQ